MKTAILILLLLLPNCFSQTITAVSNCDVYFRAHFQQTSPYNGSEFTRAVTAVAEVDAGDFYSFSFTSEFDDYQQFINPGPPCYFQNYLLPIGDSLIVPLPTLIQATNLNSAFWEQSDADWALLASTVYGFTNIYCWDWPNYEKEAFVSQWNGGDLWCDFDSYGNPRISEGTKPDDFDKWLQDGSINPSWVEPLAGKHLAKGHKK